MDTGGSRSSKGLTDDEDDEEYNGRREGSSAKEFATREEGKNTLDEKVMALRSKHSASEQRRRSKINDRFQMLKDLIPHSDQKRDKASLLLEVIEYIQFLQEKVQKYESVYPADWNKDDMKSMPWVKAFFRSFWKHPQKVPQRHSDEMFDPSQVVKNGPTPLAFTLSGDDTAATVINSQIISEPENPTSECVHKAPSASSPSQLYMSVNGVPHSQPRLSSDSANVTPQSVWSGSGHMPDGNILDEQDLTIDEGMVSVSSAYSQRLLGVLTEALQNSGVDLSQASVSVQINLGKRAFNRRAPNVKEHELAPATNQQFGDSTVGSSSEEPEQVGKRQKSSIS